MDKRTMVMKKMPLRDTFQIHLPGQAAEISQNNIDAESHSPLEPAFDT
jgi:predicted RNA binding protein with dsRBD fold (UPF0201 family)